MVAASDRQSEPAARKSPQGTAAAGFGERCRPDAGAILYPGLSSVKQRQPKEAMCGAAIFSRREDEQPKRVC
jgi:hypothetical protein